MGDWDSSYCHFPKTTWLCICFHLQEFNLQWHPNTMVSFKWTAIHGEGAHGPQSRLWRREQTGLW